MIVENKIIISENNFRAKVAHLKDDMYLYHYSGDEDFKTSNNLIYSLAVLYKGKLYDIGIRSVTQFKDEYNFEKAIQETLQAIEKQNFNCTIDNFIQVIIKQIQNKKWVTNWILSIIADYDKDNNTNYYQEGLKVREYIKAIKDKENQERERVYKERHKQREKELAEQKRIEQEEKARENFCNGFTDKLSPMQQQKVANVLNKWYRYDNGVMQRKDNVLMRLRDGWLPKIQEEVKIKLDDNERYGYKEVSKEVYSLSKDNLYLEITKTEYDYANYLINVLGLENAKLSSENK